MKPISVRQYGVSGPVVLVIHGGPGAPGHMAPVARELASEFRILEPLQRGSGPTPLTVQAHLTDMERVIEPFAAQGVYLVGSSWGAMLALAYASAHPNHVRGIIAVGCGTFDQASRAAYKRILAERTSEAVQSELDRLEESGLDPDQRLERRARLQLPASTYELASSDLELLGVDARANEESWADMLRLQAEGMYPAAFAAIDAPVLLLQGEVDPHPGQQIRDSVAPYVRRLEYRELKQCGHYPWLERWARDGFFRDVRFQLRAWAAESTQPDNLK